MSTLSKFKFDEIIEVVAYNPIWPKLFEKEIQEIKKIFSSGRIICVEHYGSTSVPDLCAKPIIDISIGLNEFSLSKEEISKFTSLGYEYFGRALAYERFFLRKRATEKFNLAIVHYGGKVWKENLFVREYLRNHNHVAREYEQIKLQALKEGCNTALTYSYYKHDFVLELVENAKIWNSKKVNLQYYEQTLKKANKQYASLCFFKEK